MKMAYKFILFTLMLVTSILSAELKSADFRNMDCYEYTDAALSVSRLQCLLNNRPDRYLRMKGYSQADLTGFEEIIFVDCSFQRENPLPILQVTLYFENINTEIDESERIPVKSHSKNRAMFSHKIQRVILSLCREFIYKDMDPSSLKIIAKHSRHPDVDDENLLFIWDGNEVRYFPLLFEVNRE